MALIGNKLDVSDTERVVHREKGQSLANEWMCEFYEASAKDSTNVDQVVKFNKDLFPFESEIRYLI